jgi:glutathione S-transferase
MAHPLTIIGNEGSPYSRKMRAVLRYRRIPHRWVVSNGPEYRQPPAVPVQVIPVLVWHADDGTMREAMVDSTPQIQRLEREFEGRSLAPADPALAWLAALVEDYADEWCTKFMFHYRWADPAGIEWARYHLMRQIDPSTPAAQMEQFASWFADRQIGRRAVVGSSEETAALLESGYLALLEALEALIAQRRFLFGDRPSAADFGLYGQLTQLCAFDPTSVRIAHMRAPRVVAWVARLEDLSGWEADDAQWLARDAARPALGPLLAEIGATYVPFLLANAAARATGQPEVVCTIRGQAWRQKTFPYQAKCLQWLREQHAALSTADRDWVAGALAGSGCESLLQV